MSTIATFNLSATASIDSPSRSKVIKYLVGLRLYSQVIELEPLGDDVAFSNGLKTIYGY